MFSILKPTPKICVVAMAGLVAALAGCSKDEQVVAPTVANEALTTTILTLTNTANPADVQTATWEQLLDSKGNPLTPDVSKATLNLLANASYTGQLGILDKSQTPTFDVGNEIATQRANYHHVFYQPLPTGQALVIPAPTGVGADTYPSPIPTPLPAGPPLNLTVTTTDVDTNTPALPLGFKTTFKTGAASTGYLRVVLRHQPNVKDGTFAPGSTDLDVGFKVSIK